MSENQWILLSSEGVFIQKQKRENEANFKWNGKKKRRKQLFPPNHNATEKY